MIDTQAVLALVQSTRDMILTGAEQLSVTVKGASDYLTQVDVGVQKYLRQGLHHLYPEIQFMGEEQENSFLDFTRPLWVLDPIDGTANLVHGMRHSAVSLALWACGEPLFGVVYQPFTGDLVYATKGGGCFWNGEIVHVSGRSHLPECLPIIGTASYDKTTGRENFDLFYRIFMAFEDIRRTGSAALDLAYVACGRADCFIEPMLRPWDFGAGLLLVREAGGTVTTLDGTAPSVQRNSGIVASNGLIHEPLMHMIHTPPS